MTLEPDITDESGERRRARGAIVHGGNRFTRPVVIDGAVVSAIEGRTPSPSASRGDSPPTSVPALHDPDRLVRLLTDRDRPVQLVVAGKAHPADQAGQAMIRAWIQFIRRPEVCGRVIFFADYDLLLTERLVQGIDLWINTPRRPWEASGTSGMKVLVNGGLNLSELDGWWAEAYAPEVGWALGYGQEHDDDPAWDAAEADALYALLEQEVVPAFYTRDQHGIPTGWVAKMRASMARLTPRFSTNRVVREYTEKYYLPLAARYRQRAADKGAVGTQLVAWRRTLGEH